MNSRLKIMRKVKRKNQQEIADLIGISQSAYSYWESGTSRVDHESMLKLANYYNVTVDFLSGRKYVLTRPIKQWTDDQQEDYLRAQEFEKEYLEYLYGKIVYVDESAIAPPQDDQVYVLDEREERLLSKLRELNEDGIKAVCAMLDGLLSQGIYRKPE